jgi:hypothetical protein
VACVQKLLVIAIIYSQQSKQRVLINFLGLSFYLNFFLKAIIMNASFDVNDQIFSKKFVFLKLKCELEVLNLSINQINSERDQLLEQINVILMSNKATSVKDLSPVVSEGFGFSFV